MTKTADASVTSTIDDPDLGDLLAAVTLPGEAPPEPPPSTVLFPQGEPFSEGGESCGFTLQGG